MHARPSVRARLVQAFGVVAICASAHAQHAITRVSVDSKGVESEGGSDLPACSADGRYVAFESWADDLVPGDHNSSWDVFVHDLATGTTIRASVNSSQVEGKLESRRPSISSDGRFVAFESPAGNFVATDANFNFDIFVRDRDPDGNGVFDEGNGVTIHASLSGGGVGANGDCHGASISGDGSLVAFASASDNLVPSDTNYQSDVFVRDLVNGTTVRESVDPSGATGGNSWSSEPRISADGAFITFQSYATNLVSGDRNGSSDIYIRDRASQVTTRVSVDSAGVEGDGHSVGPAAISSDGGVIAFYSYASNLVPGDTNGTSDVFLHDRLTGVTTRASVDSAGAQGGGHSSRPALSSDGQVVAFESTSTDLIAGDTNAVTDVFVRDVAASVTSSVCVNCADVLGDGASLNAAISGDGLRVAYASSASNLVAGDANGQPDTFVHDAAVVEPDASWNNYGAGFPGTRGIPTLTASADPKLDTTITVDVGNSSGFFTVGFMLIGGDEASIPTNDGGTLLVDFSWILPVAIWPSGLAMSVDIPADPGLCGGEAFVQAVEMDAGAQYGLSFTPGLELVLGH